MATRPEHATFWSEGRQFSIAAISCCRPSARTSVKRPTEPDADPLAEWLEACERLGPSFARTDHSVLGGYKLPLTGLHPNARSRNSSKNHHGGAETSGYPHRGPQTCRRLFQSTVQTRSARAFTGLALVGSPGTHHLHQLEAKPRANCAMGLLVSGDLNAAAAEL
jgi:hypothetical protein